MNDPTLIGPCAEYEHELVDLNDGGLPPERARMLRLHLAHCARCTAWAERFAAIDERLAAGIIVPALSPGFETRLRERLDLEPAQQGELRAAAEREYQREIEAMWRGARLRVTLDAIGSVALTLGVLAAGNTWLAAAGGWQVVVDALQSQWVLGGLASAAILVVFGWTIARGTVRLAR